MIKPIRNKKNYQLALNRAESLMDAKPGSKEFDELEVLATLIEDYEDKYYAIGLSVSIEVVNLKRGTNRKNAK